MSKKLEKTRAFTIRLSEKERTELERRSRQKTLSVYIRTCLFKPPVSKVIKVDIASVIAVIGKSGISQNLFELTQAARSGSLPLTSETITKLEQACRDIAEIKSMLMKALRVKEK